MQLTAGQVAHRGDDTVLGGLQLLVEMDVLRLQREEFGERLGDRLVAAAHVETHGVL